MIRHSVGIAVLVAGCAWGAAVAQDVRYAAWDRQLEQGKALASQGRYAEARQVFEKARAEAEHFGTADTRLAIALNNLGSVYAHLNDLNQAEQCYRRSAGVWRAAHGDRDPNLIAPLTNLSSVYLARRQFAQSESSAAQALELATAGLGPDHAVTAALLSSLANLRLSQGDYDGAAARAEQALAIMRKQPAGPEQATALDNLGTIYAAQHRPEKASPLFAEALDVLAASRQPEHPAWIRALKDQSAIDVQNGEYAKAEGELSRALELAERVLPSNHPDTAAVMRSYAQVLRKTRRKSEAKKLEAKAAVIEAQSGRANGVGYTVDVRSLSGFR